MQIVRNYTWRPDVPDYRDFKFSETFAPAKDLLGKSTLPSSVDLRAKMSSVEDQGQLGSCTANALVGSLEFLEGRKHETMIDLSRLFVYYNERVIEGTVSSDSGAMLRDGIRSLAKQGVCSEKIWPYKIANFKLKPTPPCYSDALARKITSYHRLHTIADMRACLASGFPFVFGFTVYSAFESAEVAKTGVLNMPQPGESYLGGHAVCAVGYDDTSMRLLVRNSWGKDWGQQGYFTMPYDYVASRELADDLWVVQN